MSEGRRCSDSVDLTKSQVSGLRIGQVASAAPGQSGSADLVRAERAHSGHGSFLGVTDQFDAQLDKVLDSVRDMMPESALLSLRARLRRIHAERPDLEGTEVVNIAFDVLEGEAIDARLAMEEARARRDEAAAAEARLASMERIAKRSADLDAVEALYPGRATMAEALADAGISWAYLGLSEEDGALAEEIRRGFGSHRR